MIAQAPITISMSVSDWLLLLSLLGGAVVAVVAAILRVSVQISGLTSAMSSIVSDHERLRDRVTEIEPRVTVLETRIEERTSRA